MDKKTLEAFAREVAKGLKTEKDLAEFRQILTKVTVEAALNAELDEHLGYDRHQASNNDIAVMAMPLRQSRQKTVSLS